MSPEHELPLEVLYIEDHPTNVNLMQAIFRHCNDLKLVVARSGHEAHAIAPQLHPVLLLIDLRLPDGQGDVLLQTLRAQQSWHDVPAVAVTAESAFDASKAGFCELWRKPLDLALVLERLQVLSRRAPRLLHTPLAQDLSGLRPV